jgi:hypothetical protein
MAGKRRRRDTTAGSGVGPKAPALKATQRKRPAKRSVWPYWLGGTAAVLAAAIAAIAFTANSGANHSAPTPTPSPPPGAPIDGIRCEAEMVQTHFHAHLALLQDGNQVPLPAGIGISQEAQCLYWLHTHQTDGIIHVESPGQAKFTLGQFFDVWGQPLTQTQAGPLTAPSGQQLHIFVDGNPFSGDPRSIELQSHQLLVIEIGQEVPPPGYSFPPGY